MKDSKKGQNKEHSTDRQIRPLIPPWLNSYYEVVGAFTITVAMILFLLYGIYFFVNKKEVTHVSNFTSESIDRHAFNSKLNTYNDNDSFLLDLYIKNYQLIDSIKVINVAINNISHANEYTQDRIKLFASIIGIIIAVVSFFGFKSLNDIREHTIKNSQFDSQKIATEISKEEARKIAESTALEKLNEIAQSTVKNSLTLYETDINNARKSISALEKRILHLENKEQAMPFPENNDDTEEGLPPIETDEELL